MLGKFILLIVVLISSRIFSQNWQLVWFDEFDGEQLDLSTWDIMLGDGTRYGLPSGWGNEERQYYRTENIRVADGLLTITAKKERFGGADYTSARIRSKGKADWKYGKFEIRAKMPIGKGLWPALWMMPTDNVYGGWAASGEIDIVEYLGHQPTVVHGTVHFGGEWPQNQQRGTSYTLASGTFHHDFHTFVLEWEEGKMRWYVDGVRFQSLGRGHWWSSGGSFPAPFDQYFHLLFNLAVGGRWPGYPDASTEFPQELVIDYVRVYEFTDTNIKDAFDIVPAGHGMLRNYPNPFNPQTEITYMLAQNSAVDISIYNIEGEKIATLVDGFQLRGEYTIEWSGQDMPSGIYLCRLLAGNYTHIIKMTLIR